MGGRYRALLIGNSTYPADPHNLQTLMGPVKDIAALNRALVDEDAGLFADVDVSLLPEATSTRAIRALSKFFGTAVRDDVLFVYFSGHGKLDEMGRLHLCMQDTETTDLLATAVSSTRLNEFADASHAQNVVIVLDCCYSGAFRGGDLGDAIAGPGRYVLTSCRSTQLANDATVENGTSFFTQHVIEGLVDAAPDPDGDGYVRFSELYTYVDHKLREAGKQIPQRRMAGDGDIPLAKRPIPAAAAPPLPTPPPPTPPAAKGTEEPAFVGTGAGNATSGQRWLNRKVALAGAVGTVAIAGVVTAVIMVAGTHHQSGDKPITFGPATPFDEVGPWRLAVDGSARTVDSCTVLIRNLDTNATSEKGPLYDIALVQMAKGGHFTWQVDNPGCAVVPSAGSGSRSLPFTMSANLGNSQAFTPTSSVTVDALDLDPGNTCNIGLFDSTSGNNIDTAEATSDSAKVQLTPGSSTSVYVTSNCSARVSSP